MKNMGNHHDFYLKRFFYHYLSSAGLTWNAILKMAEVKLYINTDADMYYFTEKTIEEEFRI